MNKIIIFIFSLLGVSFFLTKEAFAVCPVCTIAVASGVGLSRFIGIDDSIIGLWIGALIVSMIIWTIAWLNSKNIRFIFKRFLVSLGYYLLVIIPLYSMNIIQNVNCICGIDKLLFGIILGSIAFYFGVNLYEYLKEKNSGHAYFPFQKVLMPIAPIILLSVLFYFITK